MNKDDLLKQLNEDPTYQRVLKAVPSDIQAQIARVMDAFLDDMGKNLFDIQETLKDPEVRKELQRMRDEGKK